MLTAEIKIDNEVVARIRAARTFVVSDRPGDFIGDRATVYEYDCVVEEWPPRAMDKFTVTCDRRLGWRGLLNRITEKVMPIVIDTVSLEE